MAGNINKISQMSHSQQIPKGLGSSGGPFRGVHGINFMLSDDGETGAAGSNISPGVTNKKTSGASSGSAGPSNPSSTGSMPNCWNSETLHHAIMTLIKLRDHERIPKKSVGAGAGAYGQTQRKGPNVSGGSTTSSRSTVSKFGDSGLSSKKGGTKTITNINFGTKSASGSSDYEFTKDIFIKNPTKDLLELTHLVFTLLYPDESRLRFRDVWPVYEKKQEGDYRKIAFIWCEQLVKEYPQFFEDVKPQFSWFVKPGSDKFIKFMLKFVTCALSILADRIAKKKGKQFLPPPKIENDVPKEIMWKQLQFYKFKSNQLLENSLEDQKKINQIRLDLKKKMINDLDLETSFKTQEMEQMVEIHQIIHENPELFPPDAVENIISDERLEALKGATENSGQGDSASSFATGVDPLAYKLEETWSQKMYELNEKLQFVGDIMEDKKEIFENMKVLVENPVPEPDPPIEMPQNQCFISYLQQAQSNMELLTQMFPNTSITEIKNSAFRDKLAKQLQRAQRLIESIQLDHSSISMENSGCDSSVAEEHRQLTEHLNHQIASLSLKLEDVDWSQLIPKRRSESGEVDESWSDTGNIKKAVVLTPAKEFDFNEKGGKFRQLIPSLPSPSTSCTKEDVRRLTNAIQISESYSESPKLYTQLLKNKNVTAGAGREIQEQLQFDELSPIPMVQHQHEGADFSTPPSAVAGAILDETEEVFLLGIMDTSMPSGFLDDLDD